MRKDILQTPRHQQYLRRSLPTARRTGLFFNLQACQPVQCNPMPLMKYISPMIQVEWMVIRLMEHPVVTHLSVRLVRVMASDVEHIACGTFSSPSEIVALPTSAFIDSVVHASCDACHSMLMTLVILCLITYRRLLELSCARVVTPSRRGRRNS